MHTTSVSRSGVLLLGVLTARYLSQLSSPPATPKPAVRKLKWAMPDQNIIDGYIYNPKLIVSAGKPPIPHMTASPPKRGRIGTKSEDLFEVVDGY